MTGVIDVFMITTPTIHARMPMEPSISDNNFLLIRFFILRVVGYPYKCGYLQWHRIRDVSGPLASLVEFVHRAIHTSRIVHADTHNAYSDA